MNSITAPNAGNDDTGDYSVEIASSVIPVVLAGGSGKRLWPLSRKEYPKQFLSLTDNELSLLQLTLRRVQSISRCTPVIVCAEAHRFTVAEQLRQLNMVADIVLEPCARNTAASVLLAALHVQARERLNVGLQKKPSSLWIVPADHIIEPLVSLKQAVTSAYFLSQANFVATFGVVPTAPEVGYGYILAGDVITLSDAVTSMSNVVIDIGYNVQQFVEKPDLMKAKEYVASGQHYWNSGMIIATAEFLLNELELFQPDLVEHCRKSYQCATTDLDFVRIDSTTFSSCATISIDYALLEHTKHVAMVALACQWSDVGSFIALWQLADKDRHLNAVSSPCYTKQSHHNYFQLNGDKWLTAIGVDDLIVVDTDDALLLCHRDQLHQLPQAVEYLEHMNTPYTKQLLTSPQRVHRPWGWYECIDNGVGYKVKHIQVASGAELSLQLHHYRSEHWVVVSGVATVQKGVEICTVVANESLYIPPNTQHRLKNESDEPLHIVEIQTGDYCEEDDIVRLSDRYGRK